MEAGRMRKSKPKILWDGEEVERLRQVRGDLDRRFKTLDALCEYVRELEREDARASAEDRLPRRVRCRAAKAHIVSGSPARAR